jgi:hypothetical protein
MKMNQKAQVFRLFFLFDGASLAPCSFCLEWLAPGIPDRVAMLATTSQRAPGREGRQGEGTYWSLAPFPYDWPPERQPISFHHARGTDRAECYRMN